MTSPQTDEAWDTAPVGLLRLDTDGRLLRLNRTALSWLGTTAEELVGRRHVTDLLSVGGRLFWETHLSPLLLVEGRLDEVALELRAGDRRKPVLMSAELHDDVVVVALSSAQERVRFEHELQAARHAALTAERRVRALQTVTAALSRAAGMDAVGRELLTAATGPLGADAGTLWLVSADGRLERCGSTAAPDDEPELPPDVTSGGDRGVGSAALADADGRVLLPLRGLRELRGVLTLRPRTGAGADPLDLEVCTAVAQQAGLALDRARTYEQSADVAHELQAALLAMEPPTDDRYDVATFYRPGVEALEVGGDWYDVFLSGPGLLSVLVGDVVGRGLSAASAMGQLRSAVRAIAGPDVGPARLLARLDRFVEQVPAAGMATLAYAEVHLMTGRVRFSCAGHPPPLLVPVTGEPRLLWGGRSAPLGALFAPQERPEAEVLVAPGDRLLLCTDGLFERRDRDIDDGLQRLQDTAGRLDTTTLEDAVHVVTGAMLADEQTRDDVCVLLLQWLGDRFSRRLSADLVLLSATRRALSGWLATRGVDEPARSELVLAASEALANAAEHGAGGRPDAHVTIVAELRPAVDGPDEVVLTISDHGHWRSPTLRTDERGRGLKIIQAMVDEVDVRSGAGTTVVLRRRVGRAS